MAKIELQANIFLSIQYSEGPPDRGLDHIADVGVPNDIPEAGRREFLDTGHTGNKY